MRAMVAVNAQFPLSLIERLEKVRLALDPPQSRQAFMARMLQIGLDKAYPPKPVVLLDTHPDNE